MNPDFLRGFVKSRSNRLNTILAAGISIIAAKYGWDLTPEEMAWLVSGCFLVLNYFTRAITEESLEEKGYKPPNPKTVEAIKKEVLKELGMVPRPEPTTDTSEEIEVK